MQYQSFPGTSGDSHSEDKLAALRLPELTGRRFLDVGCNEGFFCGFARFDGAAEVVGIDRSAGAIQRARLRFPECVFLQQSWEDLPDGTFDVILLASALHYAQDQEALIHRLMGRLNMGGVLVLEAGIAPGGGDKWVKVQRGIDERLFPTRGKLARVLDPYAWKIIGYSVQQVGDPVQRYVVHVSPSKPFVYLLMAPPASGKSTISRTLFAKAGVPVVSGDRVFGLMSRGKVTAPEALLKVLGSQVKTTGYGKASQRVFGAGLAAQLVDVWIAEGGSGDFALDSYVPEEYQPKVLERLNERGYVPVMLHWGMEPTMAQRHLAQHKAWNYMQQLQREGRRLDHLLTVRRVVSKALTDRLRWHLDHPKDGEVVLGEAEVPIAGWAVSMQADHAIAAIYVRSSSGRKTYSLHKKRLDVVRACFGSLEQAPAPLKDGICGFGFRLPAQTVSGGVELGVVLDGADVPLVELGPTVNDAPSLVDRVVDRVRSRFGRRD